MRSSVLLWAFSLVVGCISLGVSGRDDSGCWEMSVVSKRPYEGGQIHDFTDGKNKKKQKVDNNNRKKRNDDSDSESERSHHGGERPKKDTSKIILTYHHIIPKSLLAKFYNRALCEQPEKLGGLFKVIKSSLMTYAYRSKSKMAPNFQQALKHWETPNDMREPIHSDDHSPHAEEMRIAQQELAKALQWAPGLLVKGPAPDLRSDDPSSALEEKVCWMTGCADEKVGGAQCTLLNAAHTAINDYLNSKGKSIHALDKALGHLRSIYGKPGDGAEFEPTFWDLDQEKGKFSANDKARQMYKNHIPADAEEQIANKGRIEKGMKEGKCGASKNGQNQKAEIESLPNDYMLPNPSADEENGSIFYGKNIDKKSKNSDAFRAFVMSLDEEEWQWFLEHHAEDMWGEFFSFESNAEAIEREEREDEGWEIEYEAEFETKQRLGGNLRSRHRMQFQ